MAANDNELFFCPNCEDYVFASEFRQHLCPDDDGDDDESNILEQFITRNSQVQGTNVRNFLRLHHSPPTDAHFLRRTLREREAQLAIALMDSYEANIALSERMGKVEVGIKNIDAISVTYSGTCEGACAICQDELAKSLNVGLQLRKLDCSHVYCDVCITRWLKKNKSCPICKHVFEDKKN